MLAGAKRLNSCVRMVVSRQADIDQLDIRITGRFGYGPVLTDAGEVQLLSGPSDVSLNAAEVSGKPGFVAVNNGDQFRGGYVF